MEGFLGWMLLRWLREVSRRFIRGFVNGGLLGWNSGFVRGFC